MSDETCGVMVAAERLTPDLERKLRRWPRERIKPATVARGLDALLAEVDRLSAIVDAAREYREAIAAPIFEALNPERCRLARATLFALLDSAQRNDPLTE